MREPQETEEGSKDGPLVLALRLSITYRET